MLLMILMTQSALVWLRVRSPGELIHDKLFGQEYFKMILLPSCFVAVLAAASAIIRTL
jgi:hypothetical protein